MTKTVLVPGYCKEHERCVCGGDLPAIQASCGNWVSTADDREEVAKAIKHCFDTGKTRFDQITDAAIATLQGLGWGKK